MRSAEAIQPIDAIVKMSIIASFWTRGSRRDLTKRIGSIQMKMSDTIENAALPYRAGTGLVHRPSETGESPVQKALKGVHEV